MMAEPTNARRELADRVAGILGQLDRSDREPTARERALLEAYERVANIADCPCREGHFGCATIDGGPCSDHAASYARD